MKIDCEMKRKAIDEKLNEPAKTQREVSIGAKGLTIKGYTLAEIGQKAVWVLVVYVFLEALGVVPDDAIKHIFDGIRAAEVAEHTM